MVFSFHDPTIMIWELSDELTIQEMTLEGYAKVLEEKRKALVTLKIEERKFDLDKDFTSMQQLSRKGNDETFIKLGSEKDKRNEAIDKEESAKKEVENPMSEGCLLVVACTQMFIPSHNKMMAVALIAFQRYMKQWCRDCNTILDEPTLCLLCGRLCSPSWKSCYREGECQTHAVACGSGTGVFLLIRMELC